ncbi:caspase-1-like isoform X2 [Macrotis lagotis]|uniref:caspase-1-like isoform X2 n=1 Tax=Macrotis lagotis TaxID=92651 RepID=UPI003D6993FD
MDETARCRLLRYLEHMTSQEMMRFKLSLVEALPRGRLENADCTEVSDLLVSFLGEQEAWDLAVSIWQRVGPKELWHRARKENLGSVSSPVLAASPAPQAIQAIDIDTLKLCPHEDFQRLKKEKIYPIMEKKARTRLALIICNIEFHKLPRRDGAEHDINGMQKLLQDLGYAVVVEKNLTALEMESELLQFASRPEHRTSDSTFLVLMSHGVPEGICGKDYTDETPQVLPINRIFQIFNTFNCPSLNDKPKIIILQACRGKNTGSVLVSDSAAPSANRSNQDLHIFENDAVRRVHVEKDFIAFCSSTPDNVSWRNIEKGSLFILQLIRSFRENAWCLHLYDIFCKVQNSFEKPKEKMQMPTIERATLTKNFYLFPGN